MSKLTAGFSADTEILTRTQGWVTFDKVTLDDEVATRSPDGRFEWHHPDSVGVERYDGHMVWFHGRSIDLLVTPGTMLPYHAEARSPQRVGMASDLLVKAAARARVSAGAVLVATSSWDAPDLSQKVFPGIRWSARGPTPRDVRMTGDQFAAFMGMYIAEGCATLTPNDHRVDISQTTPGKGYEEYRVLLRDIFGHEPGRGGNAWSLHLRALYEYMKPLGKAVDKWLPAEVMDLGKRQLEIFWRYYFLGDGSNESFPGRNDMQVAATASRQLAGQIQEIVQKRGFSGSMRKYALRPNELVKAEGFIFKVRVRKTSRPACPVSAISYRGVVAVAEVADRAVYVRRDGKPVWAGVVSQ